MINLRKTLATFSFVTLVIVAISSTVSAKTPGTFNPQISFTFDDGYLSTLQNAQPILTANEMTATAYIVPTYVAKTGYMDWAQIQKLQNTYGWEIGSHSKTHAELPKLTKTQITSELNQSLNQLKNQGLTVKTLASPYGAYDNKTLIIARRLYDAHRGFWDRDTLNDIPYNTTIISVQSVESSTTLAQVQAWVDEAKTNGDWLVLVFHEILPSLVTGDDYITTTADFSAIVNYVKQSEVPVVKVANAILPKNTNLISNGDFDTDPFTSGWQRDYVNTTLYNQLNNGSTPSPKTSVILKGSTGHPTHLYAPLVTLDNPTATYAFTSFVSADTFKAGEFGFYVDEYDTGDNWISGKWLGLVNFNNVTTFGATYTPTSLNVNKIRLQAYLTTGAKGSVYVDSFHLELIDPGTPVTPTETPTPTLTEIPTPTATITPSVVPTFTPTPSPTNTPAVTPTPTKTPTPTPTIVNLLTNPKFELLDLAGWAIDWIKSGTGISIGNHPTNGTKSLIMASTGTAHHVFSNNIPVTSGTSYAWNQDLVSQSLTDEFGFYIDEYDAGGNWISGQWLGEIHTSLTTTRNLTYTPTSANVKSAGLQYYFIGNTGGTVYVDNVVFGVK